MDSPASTSAVLRLGALRSRFGRRTLALLVACALAPVTLLAVWAYVEVRGSLLERTQARVDATAKEYAVGVVERALALRDYFTLATSSASEPGSLASGGRLRAVWHGTERDGAARVDSAALERVRAGETVLLLTPTVAPRALLVRQPPTSDGVARLAWGELAIDMLLGFGEQEELEPAICILEQASRRILQCSGGVMQRERDALQQRGDEARAASGLIASSRSIYLAYELGGRDWEAVAFRRRAEALASLSGVGRTFGLVAALSMLVVFFASHVQIRRITAPLDRLHHATNAMRAGNLAATVDVESDDEFAAVGASFNAMATRLQRQFGALEALDAVDHAALGTLDVNPVIDEAQRRVAVYCEAPRVVVVTPSVHSYGERWMIYDHSEGHDPVRLAREIPAPMELGTFLEAMGATSSLCAERLYSVGVGDARGWHWMMFPLRHAGGIEGVMAVGAERDVDPQSPEGEEARRLADRIAAAVANVRLLKELEAMGVGTLTAFARVVDANSSWTAGHSERVTAMAVALGRRAGLPEGEVTTLQRGGLLHDIGKIGVPASILDKPGRLTTEEFDVMKSHTVLGHQIVSPIAALRDVLPVVRSHHERMDGKGYPDGLRGEEIPHLARVLAVADVYDALVSDRPYRSGLTPSDALAEIRRSAGAHLDRDFVRVFLELYAEGGVKHDAGASLEAEALVIAVNAGRVKLEVTT